MPRQTMIPLAKCRQLAVCAVLLLAGSAAGQIADLRLPISIDADASDYDGRNSMMMFTGLRLSQGNIGIEADSGRASKVDFEDSVWQFSGNVRIDTGQGQIRCETADLRFAGHRLQFATITGAPATFELRRQGSEDTTYAEAGRLEYDFAGGVVEFSGNATITEGGNRISGNYLVYNIAEQRIKAESGGENGDRVKIIYTPGSNGEDGAAGQEQPPSQDEQQDGGAGTGAP